MKQPTSIEPTQSVKVLGPRMALCWLFLFAPASLVAQDRRVERGDTLRVLHAATIDLQLRPPPAHQWSKGVLLDIKSDTLMLETLGRSEPYRLLLDNHSRVDVLRGKKPFGVIKGILIGSALATIGGLIYEGTDSFAKAGCEVVDHSLNGSPIYGNCERDLRDFNGLFIALGGVIGGIGGSLLRRDRWLRVSASWSR